MYIQLNVEDTEAFRELEAGSERALEEQRCGTLGQQVSGARGHYQVSKTNNTSGGGISSVQVNFYILISFILAYGSDPTGGGMSRDTVLIAALISSAVMVAVQFWASAYSDRHGRRGIFILGAALTGLIRFRAFSSRIDWKFLAQRIGH